ncbi:hypothetical protein M2271_006066 [Streptomyces sp. LBL]|uniref:hypothetical protein n=1 Tax=Streptomyces sp. LBL TaxID=2940562 RepID=UPI002472E929|nr:hypothetical protein [Streptomyces sp. LBL]MDH6628234.1 hypothetical protein [Streptomyces sp. LBL]
MAIPRAHEQSPESALPLLRAFAELLPRVTAQGDGYADPATDGELLQRAYSGRLTRLGLTADDVDSWRPPAPGRGRPRKSAQ